MKLIIFDLDGTLIRSYHGLAKAMNMVLKSYGYEQYDYEKYKEFIGGGVSNLVYKALPQDAKHLHEEALNKMYENYRQCYDFMLEPYDGICDMLEQLQKEGHKLCVASNKDDEMTKIIVDRYFGNYKFEQVLGSSKEHTKKPNTMMIDKCINSTGVDRKDVIVVGDSNFDIEVSKNASVKSIFVTWGYRSYDQVKHLNPDILVDKPAQICDKITL